jgi:N-acyl-L-homoserine lactone synthetase
MPKEKDYPAELIKKAARLLKNETLTEEQKQAYSLHHKKLHRIKRLKYIVNNRNEQWSIDLADLNELSGYNNQYRYILVCVDIYTRYAFVKLLKTKSAKNVSNKFEQIISEAGEAPKKIQADEGTEFADIKKKLSTQYGFNLFHTQNREIKAAHAERFIQTLKLMMRRTMTTLGTSYRYIKYLPLVVERYNESPHRGIFGARPVDLYIHQKVPNFFAFKMLKNQLNVTRPVTNLLHVNDRVRIARTKNNTFEKSSLRRWVKEIFTVDKVLISDPVVYTLKDKNNENISGIFYREELQKL